MPRNGISTTLLFGRLWMAIFFSGYMIKTQLTYLF